MTRKKMTLAFMQNDIERKASYNKRKKGLMKKVEELSILCGINAFAILYGPYEDEPVIWPPSPYAVEDLLLRFKTLPDKFKRIMNQESFTKQRVDKMQEQIKKKQKDNQEIEISRVIYRCLAGEELQNFRGVVDFYDMDWLITLKLKEVARKIAFLKKNVSQLPPLEMPLKTIGNGGNNESMAALEMAMNEMKILTCSAASSSILLPKMAKNEMQNLAWLPTNNVTWSTNNGSMVVPNVPMNEMQNPTWFTNNASMVAPKMLMNEMGNLTWSTNNASLVASDMHQMQNPTWFTNNASMVASQMLMNEMHNVTLPDNNASLLAPEIPKNELQSLTCGANNAFMMAPEMPMNELQSFTWDMDMSSIDQQPWLSDFTWDCPFFSSTIDNNGAGPSNSVP